jgi:glutamyl-tRNA reductase
MTVPTLIALVAHARDVPSHLRESFAVRLGKLACRPDVVLVRTCQRVEVYLAVGARATAGVGKLAVPAGPAGTRRLIDAEAAEHLIRVVCGLDSAVLGEEQVLHQVRTALAERRAAGRLDGVLDRLFQVALHAGRQAQSWYPHPRPSLVCAALDEIARRTESVAGQLVLVVGAGMMGRLAARTAVRGGARVMVTNRTSQRAADLARSVGAEPVPWPGGDTVPPPSGVIVAVGGRWPVPVRTLDRWVAAGSVVADLSSPPALDGATRYRLGDRYLSVDAFAWRPATGLGPQLQHRLDTLVHDSGGEYCRWLRARLGGPTIQRLTTAAEQRRQAEVAWLRRRVPDLSPRDLALVEQMSRRLVAGLLHEPRRAIHDDEQGRLRAAAGELFALQDGGATGATDGSGSGGGACSAG